MSIAIPRPGSTFQTSTGKAPARALAIAGIPVYVYAVSLASLLVIVGILWDISWHRSIGRDKLLSPPHNLIYLGAVFGGLFSGIQVLWNTFKADAVTKKGLVKIWGVFYGSLGALFCIWGSIAMLTSAPFDDWWHNTYGLDVTILSPPHTVLALGMLFLQFGACVGVSKYLNQSESKSAKQVKILKGLYLVAAGSLVAMVYTILSEYLEFRNHRTGLFYMVSAASLLLLLSALGRPLRNRWAITQIATSYFVLFVLTNWILQIFPATPLLGPIQTQLTHFQPMGFPLLLFIPAAAMDLVMQKVRGNDWVKSILLSVVFISVLALVQYPFSGFLLEHPMARGWFFGSHTWYFGSPPNWEYRYAFAPWEIEPLGSLLKSIGIAVLIGGLVTARLGLRWGKWLSSIQR
jgi:hypothetical protein